MIVSLASMKTYLGITDTSYDTFLTEQLQLVSDVVEAYCRRKFEVATYVQTYYNDHGQCPVAQQQLLTFQYPVTAITSIVEDGTTLDASLYRTHLPTGTIVKKNCGLFMYAAETVVTYTAGFTTLPTPVVGVVKAIVEERYNKKNSGVALNFGSDVQRISIPGAISIDFDYSLSNNDRKSAFGTIIGNHANVLDYYRSDRAILPSDKLEFVV